MKKILILYSILFSFQISNQLFAQDEIDLKIGLIQSNISTEFTNTYQYKTGKTISLALKNYFGNYFSFNTAFSYLEYGYVVNENESYYYNYYSIAGLFNLRLAKILNLPLQNFNADIQMGPNFLIVLNAEHKRFANSNIEWRNILDLGMVFGFQIQYRFLLAGIHFNKGFTNIIDNTENSSPEYNLYGHLIPQRNESQSNKAWIFSIGYAFKLE